MKKATIAIVVVAFSLQSSLTVAAPFSSTAMLNQSFDKYMPTFYFSRIRNTYNSSFAHFSSGANSVSVMVDTDLDRGTVSGLQFKPITLDTSTSSNSLTTQSLVVDVPGNFPIPPVTHIETRNYSDRITVTRMAPVTPTWVSSTTGAIEPLNYRIPWFQMLNDLVIALPSFIVEGTYEAKGPTVTRSFPFAVEFQPIGGLTQAQRIGVRGGQNFTNGFEFLVGTSIFANYRAVNPVIFNQEVDGVNFLASFSTNDITIQLLQGASVPEPGQMGLAAVAAMALAVAAPRRRVAA